MLRKYPYILSFQSNFSMKKMFDFVKYLFSIEMKKIFIYFSSFSSCDVIMSISFLILNHFCIPAINPSWLSQIILQISCWKQFGSILLRIFHLYSSGYWPVVPFSSNVLFYLGYQEILQDFHQHHYLESYKVFNSLRSDIVPHCFKSRAPFYDKGDLTEVM